MSDDYKVPFTEILSVQDHPNADRLSICKVYGFNIITGKNIYKVGDRAILVPIDSVLGEELEKVLFPEGSKITLHKGRVKQINIRKVASQGMLIDPKSISHLVNPDYLQLEQDLSHILKISKYEPPVPGFASTIGKDKQRNKKYDTPNFHKYNGLNNIKFFPGFFEDGEQVIIQEKLHGTNTRAGLLPWTPVTRWHKLLKFLRLAPKVFKAYGSNNVDISASGRYKGFYGSDVYGDVFKKLDIFSKLKLGETVFGEIVGPSIQKGYTYGLKEHRFVLFDVKVLQPDGSQVWLTPDEVQSFAKERALDMVPVLYKGVYNESMAYSLTKGRSEYNDKSESVREGIVIKSAQGYSVDGNKRALKWVSEDYLAKDQTDFH